jgi:hypothetical protein
LLAGPRTVTPPVQTPSPSPSPSLPPRKPDARPSAAAVAARQLESAVLTYYGLVPDDLDEAWAMLGPRLRAKGRDAYDAFWQRVSNLRIIQPPRAADSDVLVTIEYSVDGKGSYQEEHRLGMITRGGRQLIDSDHVVGSRHTPVTDPS